MDDLEPFPLGTLCPSLEWDKASSCPVCQCLTAHDARIPFQSQARCPPVSSRSGLEAVATATPRMRRMHEDRRIRTEPSHSIGHLKRPFAKRFPQHQNPGLSQNINLIRLRERLQTECPNGSLALSLLPRATAHKLAFRTNDDVFPLLTDILSTCWIPAARSGESC